MKTAKPRRSWQIKVEIEGTWPPIWRRILVPESVHLLGLHEVIQAAFNWQDYHLHEFEILGVRYGDPANDEYGDMQLQDEGETKLLKLGLSEGESFSYIYDFGDNWQHILRLEKIRPIKKRPKLPRCLAGQRACPPEDVGGIGGYAGFLEALADPKHPEHESNLEWVGGAFDPEIFDLEAVNARLVERAQAKRAARWVLPEGGEGTASGTACDSSVYKPKTGAADEKIARDLPLRRDVLTLLVYIRDHKITGTQSTGNLPLKAAAEVSSAFVDPPALETRIGEKIFPFRSEDEIRPLFFAHKLANGADLIAGGPGRRWRLSPRGEQFLSISAAVQVFMLLHAWWHRINWLMVVRYDVFGDALSPVVPQAALSLLRELRIGQSVEFEPFVNQMIDEVGWAWDKREWDGTPVFIRTAVEQMLVDPLDNLGVISTRYVKERESSFKWEKLEGFSLTDFGRTLLEGLH